MGRALDMYDKGRGAEVWVDLVAAGPDAVAPDRIAETREIARRTMLAVRRNLERLIAGLSEWGYEFAPAPGDDILADSGVSPDTLDELEQRIGALPVALRAFAEHIGSVSLAGRRPEWDGNLADPLILTFDADYVLSEHGLFLEDRGTEYERTEFAVELAPDHLHKADISGGAPFSMVVPCEAADSLLRGEGHQTTLVNYLRTALRWGGFPGWDPALGQRGTGLVGEWPAELRALAGTLDPI